MEETFSHERLQTPLPLKKFRSAYGLSVLHRSVVVDSSLTSRCAILDNEMVTINSTGEGSVKVFAGLFIHY